MSQIIRRGRLEVETDLLLGVDDVLLPRSMRSAMPTSGAPEGEPAPMKHSREAPPTVRRGFDADLFAPNAAARGAALPREVDPPAAPRPERSGSLVEPRVTAATAEAVAPLVDRIVPPSEGSRADRLAELQRLHATNCPHCTVATGHTNLVFGEGSPDAELVFVGEAPGETEDRSGRPFVGPAGEKLDEMIAAMGLRRDEVYIANVLKSRPPNNRTPLAQEVERCGPYLLAQLAILRPKAIVTLGGPATKLLLASELGITRLRGVATTVRLCSAEGAPIEVPVLPTFHPAYLLRNYTVETRRQVWSDLKQALALIGREAPRRA
jgi:uracil-DNA glycosylase